MTARIYFGKMNSTLGSVVPLAMFSSRYWRDFSPSVNLSSDLIVRLNKPSPDGCLFQRHSRQGRMSGNIQQQRAAVEQLRREANIKRISVSQAVEDIKVRPLAWSEQEQEVTG